MWKYPEYLEPPGPCERVTGMGIKNVHQRERAQPAVFPTPLRLGITMSFIIDFNVIT